MARALRGTSDREISYEGIDTSADALARAMDHRYVRRTRAADGSVLEEWSRARFRAEIVMTISGCPFRVLVWTIERRVGPGDDAAVRWVQNLWYAPELRTFLRSQARSPDEPPGTDTIAVRIDTQFTPLE